MTKKNYILIADIFKYYLNDKSYNEEDKNTIMKIRLSFENMLENDNPRFDRRKFDQYISK